jgi:tryptophan-rich sensory protein
MRWISLLWWLVLCFAVGGVGAIWTTTEVESWYRTLIRPGFAPPDWVFGPVWTLLYAMMAIAAWLVWRSPQSLRRSRGILVFLTQLALNFAWTLIFFHYHRVGAALLEIVLLWIAIVATIVLFRRISSASAWLLAPYLAWVSFATILNAGFWHLN